MSNKSGRVVVVGSVLCMVLLATSGANAQPVVFQAGLNVFPFAGLVAGDPQILMPKYSVIDDPNGLFGGSMFVPELASVDVLRITPAGAQVSFTAGFGPFGSGPGGIDIDGPTADLPGATAGLYGGPGSMYVVEVNGPGINRILPSGAWTPFAAYGTPAGLHFDRTPGFAYSGQMYITDWGGDANDGVLSVSPAGVVASFAPDPNNDPRYLTFDSRSGTPFGPDRLWITEYATGEVRSITPGGVINPALATLDPGIEGLSFGLGDAIFGSDLYVANLTTGAIDKIDPNGVVTPFADFSATDTIGAAYLQFVTDGPYAIGGQPALYVDNGRDSIWVITPVPEPATMSLLALGALPLLRRRRRNRNR